VTYEAWFWFNVGMFVMWLIAMVILKLVIPELLSRQGVDSE